MIEDGERGSTVFAWVFLAFSGSVLALNLLGSLHDALNNVEGRGIDIGAFGGPIAVLMIAAVPALGLFASRNRSKALQRRERVPATPWFWTAGIALAVSAVLVLLIARACRGFDNEFILALMGVGVLSLVLASTLVVGVAAVNAGVGARRSAEPDQGRTSGASLSIITASAAGVATLLLMSELLFWAFIVLDATSEHD